MPETVARALDRTFERYWDEFVARRDGTKPWERYTPYELRTVGTMVRLGQARPRARAARLVLQATSARRRGTSGRRSSGAIRRRRSSSATCRTRGSGRDYIRSVLDMFAYEREADSSLVIGAGIPESWVTEKPGVTVRRLSTHYGALSYTMRSETGTGAGVDADGPNDSAGRHRRALAVHTASSRSAGQRRRDAAQLHGWSRRALAASRSGVPPVMFRSAEESSS